MSYLQDFAYICFENGRFEAHDLLNFQSSFHLQLNASEDVCCISGISRKGAL